MLFKRQALLTTVCLWLGSLQLGFTQPALILANLQPEDAGSGSSLPFSTGYSSTQPYDFAVVNGIGYFAAEDAIHGMELWRTDGTPEGTRMVADISAGPQASGPKQFMAGETLVYFTASGPYGQRLFRSDGTAGGTYPVRDELPRGSANWRDRWPLGIMGDQLYFAAKLDEEIGYELWTTDGSRAGTRLVKHVQVGGGSGALLGNRLFFSASNGSDGFQLWETDGTAAGTRQVKNLVPPEKLGGLTGYWINGYPQNFLAADDLVYFTATSPVDGREWWRTDGTAEGTFMLPQFAPERPAHDEAGFSSIWQETHAITLGNNLFYSACRFDSQGLNYTAVPALAVSDGTPAGTRLLREKLEIQFMLTKCAGKVWFIAKDRNAISDPEHYCGLWAATADECHFVASVKSGSRLMAAGDKLYCTNPAGGLMTVDAVTEEVSGGGVWNEIEEEWSIPAPLFELDDYTGSYIGLTHSAAVGSRVFFSLFTAEYGWEPWITDGTPEGTKLLQDIYQHPVGSSDISTSAKGPMFMGSQGVVYFPARNVPGSMVYYLTRYTEETGTTEAIPDYSPSMSYSSGWGTELGDIIICALSPTVDRIPQTARLYVISGPEISPLVPASDGEYLNSPFGFTRSGANVFFFGQGPAGELSLWRTAGTAETTVKVKTWTDSADTDWQLPGSIVISGGRIFFSVFYVSSTELSAYNYALFSSDGTPEGTYSFATVPTFYLPTSGGSPSGFLVPLGDGVVFGKSIGYGFNDGTEEGTVAFNFFENQVLTSIVPAGGKIWYTVSGEGLWCTDGTPAGTRQVSSAVSYIRDGFEFKGKVYLYDGGGIVSVDPEQGTIQPVFTIDPEIYGSIFRAMPADDFIYFTLSDNDHGIELWRTDGTPAGVSMVQDIWPGIMSSDAANLRQIGTNLFFTATDHRGQEPWIMPVSLSAPAKVANPGDLVTITGKSFQFQPTLISGTVLDWRWRNLPAGLSYDNSTGEISGVPQMNGAFAVAAEAASSGGTYVMSFTLRVVDPDYARISLTPAIETPGKLSLSLDAIAGLKYQVFTSDNLIDWEPLVLDAESDLFLPEIDMTGGKRFYKVITLGTAP